MPLNINYNTVERNTLWPVISENVSVVGVTAERPFTAYVLLSHRVSISAIFVSQQDSGFIQECRDSCKSTEPTVGIYDEDPIPGKVADEHIDQMTGHGINRILHDYAGRVNEDDNSRVERFPNSPIVDNVTVEPFYTEMPLRRNVIRAGGISFRAPSHSLATRFLYCRL